MNKFVVWRKYGDRGIVVHTRKGEMWIVNETAIKIIEMIASGQKPSEIVKRFKKEYEGNAEEIKKTVEKFISHLIKIQLVTVQTH